VNTTLSAVLVIILGMAVAIEGVLAQSPPAPSGAAPHEHGAMSHRGAPGVGPALVREPGQDAFAAIAEVVRLLDADPTTDWSKVDLERLRQHLIDMNEVVLHAQVTQTPVPGGLAMAITGGPRTEAAIRAMVVPHAAELDAMPGLSARTETIDGGVRLTVTARPADDRQVARIRGLGFAGLLTLGAHHGPHHVAMARGEAVGAHQH